MKKVIDYLLSSVYLLYFIIVLLVFHAYQVVAFNVFGKDAHKRSVDYLNFAIAFGWYLTGSSIRFTSEHNLPTDRPIIFMPNHQSMFDISPIIWFLRRHHPLFVSKVELSKGIPSISYNLRKSGAAIINRNDSKQAIVEIARLGKLIEDTNSSAVIFAEGTRSSSGKMRPFVAGGLSALLKKAPRALVVPIAIQGSGRFNPQKTLFPLTSFTPMSWTVLAPIEPSGLKPDEIAAMAQAAIQRELDQQRVS